MKQLDPSSAEQLVDLFFEIGRDQAKNFLHSEAIRWLERAYDFMSSLRLENLSSDANELQLSILHSMVKSLMSLGGEENMVKAWAIVGELEIKSGNRLAVLLLKLDLYDTDSTSSPHEYCDVLRKIVCSVHLTESNVKTILHQAHKLRRRNTGLAHSVLSTFISERLLEAEETAWLEKALITVVWNCTTSIDLNGALHLLEAVIDTVAASSIKALSLSATHAAHIVRQPSWPVQASGYSN